MTNLKKVTSLLSHLSAIKTLREAVPIEAGEFNDVNSAWPTILEVELPK